LPQPLFRIRSETFRATLYCLAATALFFRSPLFFARHFHIPHDLLYYHYPYSQLIAWSLREYGRFPWWNPFSFMGEPLFGNVQAAMFYPPKLLLILLSNVLCGQLSFWLLELELMAHVALAGLGAYTLLRLLGTAAVPALAGATIYQLGAFFASQTQHLGLISVGGWLPWFVAALYRLEQRRDWSAVAVAAVPLAGMIMAGYPPGYTPALVLGPLLYALWMWQSNPRWEWRTQARPAVLLVAALLLGLLLSAVSWYPGYQVARRSVATQSPERGMTGLKLEAATSFVWPNLFHQLRGEPWLTSENPIFLHLYQGIPGLLLVFGGLGWLARSARSRPFLVAATVALLWMFGKTFFVSQLIYLLFPSGLRGTLHPQYYQHYFSLFFAVLAGLALDGYERGERHTLFPARRCRQAAAWAGVVALLACAAGLFASPESSYADRAVTSGTPLFLVAGMLALCGLLVRGQAGATAESRHRLAVALCGLILFDLVTVGSNNHNNTGPGDGQDVPAAVSFLRQHLGPHSLYRMDTSTSELGYQWQARVPLWRLPSANGFESMLLRDTVAYRTPFSRLGDRQFDLEQPESPLLDLAGVRYIVSSRTAVAGAKLVHQSDVYIYVFENPRALPRYFLVAGVVGARDVREAVRLIHTREVDPARVAVVLDSDLGRFSGLTGPAPSTEMGDVQVLLYSPNEIRLRVRAAQPAVLVATEVYWPDWRAEVDGAPQPIVRADGLFRAVGVPAGTHEVRMFIVPWQLYLGAGGSGIGLLLTCFCLLWPAARPSQVAVSAAETQA